MPHATNSAYKKLNSKYVSSFKLKMISYLLFFMWAHAPIVQVVLINNEL